MNVTPSHKKNTDGKIAFIIGNEVKGISPNIKKQVGEQPILLTIPKEDGAISEQDRHDSRLFDEYGSGLGLMAGGGPSNEAQEAAFDRELRRKKKKRKGRSL